MSKLDEFESAFKSASKAVYSFARVKVAKVLVVTDLTIEQSQVFAEDVKDFLDVLGDRSAIEWHTHHVSPEEDVGDLLREVENERPDLICCYRNLHGRARSFPFSLGSLVDVLTQATSTPVLLLPAPTKEGRLDPSSRRTTKVMVLTDLLTGCDRLINYGVHFADADGTLVLAHLEDDTVFERYIETIGKIPAIDTELARDRIRVQLLKEPSDYIESARAEINRELDCELTIVKEVTMGHRVADCKALIESHDIALVVMITKDDDQLAMHGLAYPLAVELRSVPLLML